MDPRPDPGLGVAGKLIVGGAELVVGRVEPLVGGLSPVREIRLFLFPLLLFSGQWKRRRWGEDKREGPGASGAETGAGSGWGWGGGEAVVG